MHHGQLQMSWDEIIRRQPLRLSLGQWVHACRSVFATMAVVLVLTTIPGRSHAGRGCTAPIIGSFIVSATTHNEQSQRWRLHRAYAPVCILGCSWNTKRWSIVPGVTFTFLSRNLQKKSYHSSTPIHTIKRSFTTNCVLPWRVWVSFSSPTQATWREGVVMKRSFNSHPRFVCACGWSQRPC